ncbi:Isoflavone reductase homolog P3 OS=Arabidopsis thaliana GN=At1g75280 PE=1 SV=1 [Rhizoctonia solani AG-1 IB]|uniref:Isoflavone reductase homolog P3 n=1 Tax=Thanatephorus cucumeris (strain AG1-IB / isolate 7/3/14) TaxID=1108050 RepID=A0A0B7FS78_THACB|nr:Isoflavone reductase homolog P3 OS=Arabidopsis thaliana GN=At1g75280 PE=1 SV=1 [Rhizoctonia solani AG-1 IB]
MATKTVALAGANGPVGKSFAQSILDQGLELRVLARFESIESSVLQDLASRGASVRGISYEDESSIFEALKGVDVLVSTVAPAAMPAQFTLIKAAKAAGVKLFFPSEYGGTYEDPSNDISPFLQLKKTIINTAKQFGLPYAVLSTGGFIDLGLSPVGLNFSEKKVNVWGDGNTKITWTTISSTADWIANVLKTVPIEQLQNKHLRIQGDAASVNEIIKLWEQKHNVSITPWSCLSPHLMIFQPWQEKLEVIYHPTKELEERLDADKNDIFALILREWALGRGEIGGKDNGLYPAWKPDTVESVL